MFRVGLTPGKTGRPEEFLREPTWLFIWWIAWPDARSRKLLLSRPNTIGIAIRSNRFSILSRPRCPRHFPVRARIEPSTESSGPQPESVHGDVAKRLSWPSVFLFDS